MSVFTLAYRSRNLIEQQTADSAAEIERLLQTSRARNLRLGITGALLFNEGRFVQILEGEKAAVLDVMESIKRDSRHTDIEVLPPRCVPERTFSQWSMAYIGEAPEDRACPRKFALGAKLDWTRTTPELLAALVVDLITPGSVIPKSGECN